MAGSGFGLTLRGRHDAHTRVRGIWGERHPLTSWEVQVLRDANTASTRSRTESSDGVSDFLITGPIALCNTCCSRPECFHFLPTKVPDLDFSNSEEDDDGFTEHDWTGVSTRHQPLPDGTPVRLVYAAVADGDDSNASQYSNDGEGGDCRTCFLEGRIPNTRPRARPRTPNPRLGRAFSASDPINPTNSSSSSATPPPPVAKRPAKKHRKLGPLLAQAGHKLPFSTQAAVRLVAGTYNVAGRLRGPGRGCWLYTILASMFAEDISVVALAESGTQHHEVHRSASGVSQELFKAPSDNLYRYHSLSSTCPATGRHSGGGAGCTLVWDGRLSHDEPFWDTQGRLVAITLLGPYNTHVRVIGIYGFVDPCQDKAGAIRLVKLLKEQIALARSKHQFLLVLGDVNEHLSEAFPRPKSNRPKGTSLLRVLKEANLADVFRVLHPTVNGATITSKTYQRSTKGSSRKKVIHTIPSRIDMIWAPRRWVRHHESKCAVVPSLLTMSDHYAVLASFSFKLAMDCSASEARHNQSPTSQKQLDLSKVQDGKGQAAYWAAMAAHPLMISLTADIEAACLSDDPSLFTDSPDSDLSKLMSSWFSLVTETLPDPSRKKVKIKPRDLHPSLMDHSALLGACTAV